MTARPALPRLRAGRAKREFANAPVACDAGRAAGCATWCCHETLIVIAAEDLEDGLRPEPGFLDLLSRDERGACIHLEPNGRCGVWERRPLDCRLFSCEGRRKPERRLGGEGCLAPTAPCAHCGENAGLVAFFAGTDGAARCSACGGPFDIGLAEGGSVRVRPGPAPLTRARRLIARAEVREHLGDLEAAQAAYAEAAREDPDNVEHELGRIRTAMARGDEDAVGDAFARAESLDAARAWLTLALARQAAGLDGAEEAFRRAEALGSRSPWLPYGRARIARECGDAEEAAALLAEAARRAGPDPRIVQDLVDLAREGIAEATRALRELGDRRGLAAIGQSRAYLASGSSSSA